MRRLGISLSRWARGWLTNGCALRVARESAHAAGERNEAGSYLLNWAVACAAGPGGGARSPGGMLGGSWHPSWHRRDAMAICHGITPGGVRIHIPTPGRDPRWLPWLSDQRTETYASAVYLLLESSGSSCCARGGVCWLTRVRLDVVLSAQPSPTLTVEGGRAPSTAPCTRRTRMHTLFHTAGCAKCIIRRRSGGNMCDSANTSGKPQVTLQQGEPAHQRGPTTQRSGWGFAGCGSCNAVGLRWWAGVCCVCLWSFPDLVPACFCIPNHRVAL